MASAHRRLAILALLTGALLLVTSGCSQDPADDDDTTADTPICEQGFVHDPELPEEFLEEYADGCVPAECGVGRWGDLLADGDTVYVDVAADDSGNGSEEEPFNVIQDGLDAAGAAGGGPVAVAAGTYVENLYLTGDHDGVHLAGRCRELVVLDGSGGQPTDSGIEADGGVWGTEEWTVSGVTVTGAPYGGIWLDGGLLSLITARLVRNNLVGIFAAGNASDLLLDNAEIQETQALPDGTFGRGINVQEGARLEASSCVVEGNAEVGVYVSGEGTEVTLRAVEVWKTQPETGGTGGRGIEVSLGARLEASSCVVEGNAYVGIAALHAGTEVFLQGVEIRDTQPSPEGMGGCGIKVVDGARLEAVLCVVEGNVEVGILAGNEGTEVVLQGVDVGDTQPLPDGKHGWGIGIMEGARLAASSCVVEENAEVGILAVDDGTEIVLHGVEVRDTQPLPDGTHGRGIQRA